MLATKAWIYGKLSTDASVLSAFTDTDHVTDAYPEKVEVFPLLVFMDKNQADMEYGDNAPVMSAQSFEVHVFTKLDLETTTNLSIPVYDLFRSLDFSCTMNGEVPDPVEGVRHRVMRFSRELFPSDLI
ncbi:MAG: hypothetical protein WC489_09025 [Patescibacteria group bacterium]|jgi:hypothetical protein